MNRVAEDENEHTFAASGFSLADGCEVVRSRFHICHSMKIYDARATCAAIAVEDASVNASR